MSNVPFHLHRLSSGEIINIATIKRIQDNLTNRNGKVVVQSKRIVFVDDTVLDIGVNDFEVLLATVLQAQAKETK